MARAISVTGTVLRPKQLSPQTYMLENEAKNAKR